MAVMFTEDPKHPTKPRFDTPIKEQVWPPEKYPESHSGIGCGACHSVVHVKSTMGNSDYTLDYPPMHKYLVTNNQLAKGLHNFLTRLAPEPHKKTFLRPFHRDQTAKFCSSCHKVHLDQALNGYRWLRGQNEYDAWQQSGVSGFGAASFYYPMDEKTGQPSFKKCADCHMPKVASKDAGNKEGMVKSHAFPAANTALPFVYHDQKQLELTQKFLQDKALTIDIFGIRREKEGAKKSSKPDTKAQTPKARISDTPQAATLNGDNGNTPMAAANASLKEEILTAPINRGGVGAGLKRGESPLVDVVVRTRKLGHAFPGGTIDAFDIWVELEAKDSNGKTIYHSGKLQWENGPVEEAAHRYRSLLVDAHSNRIDRRNVASIRTVVYAKTIPPGAADVVHFRLKVPKGCGNAVTLTAKLNYRKFDWWNNYFMYAGRTSDDPKAIGLGVGKTSGPVGPGWDERLVKFDADTSTNSGEIKEVPNLPITVVCQDSLTLPVTDGTPETLVVAMDDTLKKKDRERWNDYGIGLLLQGDFRKATSAFESATKVAPKWPEAYVNIGRVRQAERDTPAAQAAFQKAFDLYGAAPTPMTPYQKARTQNFYAQSLFDQGKLDEALKVLAEAMEVFPEDRNLHNLSGTILFRLGRYDEGIVHLKKTLAIDPEDIAAHYNLMKCFRAKGDTQKASTHEALYKRFKADESATQLTGPYKAKHKWDNNLAQLIHEQPDAVMNPKPTWLIERERKIARRQKETNKKVALR